MSNPVFTLGHSSMSFDEFLALVRKYDIQVIGDVRSTPRSRYHPHFDRSSLKDELEKQGVDYVFLGHGLGGRPKKPGLYSNGYADYDAMSQTSHFRRDIKRILTASNGQRVALLCTEKDPLTCHRGLLVARHLEASGAAVHHIHRDGSLEGHQDAEARLLRETGGIHGNLFKGRAEVLADAYSKRTSRVAYSETAMPDATGGKQ